jgi:hypothetical protein
LLSLVGTFSGCRWRLRPNPKKLPALLQLFPDRIEKNVSLMYAPAPTSNAPHAKFRQGAAKSRQVRNAQLDFRFVRHCSFRLREGCALSAVANFR